MKTLFLIIFVSLIQNIISNPNFKKKVDIKLFDIVLKYKVEDYYYIKCIPSSDFDIHSNTSSVISFEINYLECNIFANVVIDNKTYHIVLNSYNGTNGEKIIGGDTYEYKFIGKNVIKHFIFSKFIDEGKNTNPLTYQVSNIQPRKCNLKNSFENKDYFEGFYDTYTKKKYGVYISNDLKTLNLTIEFYKLLKVDNKYLYDMEDEIKITTKRSTNEMIETNSVTKNQVKSVQLLKYKCTITNNVILFEYLVSSSANITISDSSNKILTKIMTNKFGHTKIIPSSIFNNDLKLIATIKNSINWIDCKKKIEINYSNNIRYYYYLAFVVLFTVLILILFYVKKNSLLGYRLL